MQNNFNVENGDDITIRLLTIFDALKNEGKIKTQKEFCSFLGISEAFYTEIKKGRSGVNPDRLQNMSPELSEYREWLLTGKNSPFQTGKLTMFGNNRIRQNDLEVIFHGNIPDPKYDEIMRTDSGLVVLNESLWNATKKALDFYENLDKQGKVDVDMPTEKKQLIIIEHLQHAVKSQQRTIENMSETINRQSKIIETLTSK